MKHALYNIIIDMLVDMINAFLALDDETLKKYGVDDDHWIAEDYWNGFEDAIEGLKLYLMKED